MTQKNIDLKKRKKERIKINNINDFKNALKREGYKIKDFEEEKFKEEIIKVFKVDKDLAEQIYIYINDSDVTYRSNDIKDFIDYIEKIIVFENEHNKLCKKIKEVKKLNIHRVEYERLPSRQDNVEEIIKIIEEIKYSISESITEAEKAKLEDLENEIGKECLYAKDIELLKKMILSKKEEVKEKYNYETQVRTISIEIPNKIDLSYIKAKIGTVEYHEYLTNNIPRILRLIKNLNKYMEVDEKEKTTFNIDQSKAIQDTVNIAVATYDNKEFKAISGSNNITSYCSSPSLEESIFESCKVNKLGKLGVGYKRINDSEKKILEEIHKQIEEKILKDEGHLILYSKWEPCPSCYFVISQFCKRYPNIKVKVKYSDKYGE